MRVVQVSLEALERFAYCSMLYRLKDHLQLPSFAPSLESGYQFALYAGFRSYFEREIRRATDKVGSYNLSMNAALQSFKSGVSNLARCFPERLTKLSKLTAEGLMTLRMFYKCYNPSTCYPLAFALPINFTRVVGDTQFLVTAKIDFIFNKNNDTLNEETVAVLLANTDDPIQDLANLHSIRRGVVQMALRESGVIKNRFPISLVEINVLNEEPQAVTVSDNRNLEVFLDNALVGIASGMAIPTADPEKCYHCPYQKVCQPRLASIVKGSIDHEILKDQIIGLKGPKPYFKQLIK